MNKFLIQEINSSFNKIMIKKNEGSIYFMTTSIISGSNKQIFDINSNVIIKGRLSL